MSRKRSRAAASGVEKYNVGFRPQSETESDIEYYKAMAHSANQRLRSLEKLSDRPNFRGVRSYAYANAQYDISHITGTEEKTRFPETVPRTASGEINQRELHRRLNAVTRFMAFQDST